MDFRKDLVERMPREKERHIGMELKAVNNLIRRNLDLRFSESDNGELSGIQGPVIGFLYWESKKRDVFQKDIEKEFGIRRSTATVMLQSLEKKGMIERVSVNHDARLKKILLTPKAVECNRKIMRQIDTFNQLLESGISKQEKEEFLRILDKISENLK